LSERPTQDIDYKKLAELTEYFVSADIELIVTEAAREAVALDKDYIDQEIIERTIKSTTPSILEDEIEYYKQFASMERI
jgi:transitional endoplasmic reticulum ATPase